MIISIYGGHKYNYWFILVCTFRDNLSNHNTPPVTTADNVAIAVLLAQAVGWNSTITIEPFKIIGQNVIVI